MHRGHENLARYLVAQGARRDTPNVKGKTPWMLAKQQLHRESRRMAGRPVTAGATAAADARDAADQAIAEGAAHGTDEDESVEAKPHPPQWRLFETTVRPNVTIGGDPPSEHPARPRMTKGYREALAVVSALRQTFDGNFADSRTLWPRPEPCWTGGPPEGEPEVGSRMNHFAHPWHLLSAFPHTRSMLAEAAYYSTDAADGRDRGWKTTRSL